MNHLQQWKCIHASSIACLGFPAPSQVAERTHGRAAPANWPEPHKSVERTSPQRMGARQYGRRQKRHTRVSKMIRRNFARKSGAYSPSASPSRMKSLRWPDIYSEIARLSFAVLSAPALPVASGLP